MMRCRKTTAMVLSATAAATSAVALLMSAGSAQALPMARISADGTAVRVAPTTAGAVRTRLSQGTTIEIKCQDIGETVRVDDQEASGLWDFLPAYNGWVSDLLVTGDPSVEACEAPKSGNRLVAARMFAGRRVSIGFNPFAARYGDQCTYYAESRMAQQTGKFMPVYGHAYQWAAQAKVGGWSVGKTPAVNSVAVFPKDAFGSPYGHVAWVVAVKGKQVRIQDYNWNGAGANVTDHWVQIVPATQFIYADK